MNAGELKAVEGNFWTRFWGRKHTPDWKEYTEAVQENVDKILQKQFEEAWKALEGDKIKLESFDEACTALREQVEGQHDYQPPYGGPYEWKVLDKEQPQVCSERFPFDWSSVDMPYLKKVEEQWNAKEATMNTGETTRLDLSPKVRFDTAGGLGGIATPLHGLIEADKAEQPKKQPFIADCWGGDGYTNTMEYIRDTCLRAPPPHHHYKEKTETPKEQPQVFNLVYGFTPEADSEGWTKVNAKEQTMNTEAVIENRGKDYGKYSEVSRLDQAFKTVLTSGRNWDTLPDNQKTSLEMITHKIARILNGDPNKEDTWLDISGYSTLPLKILRGEEP